MREGVLVYDHESGRMDIRFDLLDLITMVVCTVVRNSKSRLEMYGYQPALNSVIFGIYMVLGLAT